jgi:hypothetical protein
MRPHFSHSNVVAWKPDGVVSSFDSNMRRCPHAGQLGRSMAEICADDTG